jgi:uncharacterized protein with von Willebrand factor type A (vWA) domain
MTDPRHGADDPFAVDYRITNAVDIISERVLAGADPHNALQALLRDGDPDHGLMGLNALRERLDERGALIEQPVDLPAAFNAVGDALDDAVRAEHRVLFADPDDLARIEEAELAALPSTRAAQVSTLSERMWRHQPAADKFAAAWATLRRRTIGVMLARLTEAVEAATPDTVRRGVEMLDAAHGLINQHYRSAVTAGDLADFHRMFGEAFRGHPARGQDLIDELAWRISAEQRFLSALSDDERRDLDRKVKRAVGPVNGYSAAVVRLHRQVRAARPDVEYGGDPRFGESALHLFADTFDPIAELADVELLAQALDQNYPGASVEDISEALVGRLLGRRWVAELDALRRVGHTLVTDGWLLPSGGQMELSARALRHLGRTALRQALPAGRRRRPVAVPPPTSRRWTPGETAPVDIARSLSNAVLRTRRAGRTQVRVLPADLEVLTSEEAVGLSTVLIINGDPSSRAAALAMLTLVRTQYPQDELTVVLADGQPRVAHEVDLGRATPGGPVELPAALALARRTLSRARTSDQALLVGCAVDSTSSDTIHALARAGVHVYLSDVAHVYLSDVAAGLAAGPDGSPLATDLVRALTDLRDSLGAD